MKVITAAIVAAALAAGLSAQQPQTPTTPAPAPAPAAAPRRAKPPRVAAARMSSVIVRDRSGSPIEGVKVAISGAASQQAVTGTDGTSPLGALRDGTYRLRFERDGFLTLEREVSIRGGQPAEIEVALNLAPPPPEPPPPPAPAAAPPPSTVAAAPSGPPVFVSIPQFLEKNYIGREPLKESVLGCLAGSTTRLLQLHDGLAEHTHGDLDEVLYVVAGEGTIRVRGESAPVTAGSLSIIPHGQPHVIDRGGKNPLMLLSMLSGAPCRAAAR